MADWNLDEYEEFNEKNERVIIPQGDDLIAKQPDGDIGIIGYAKDFTLSAFQGPIDAIESGSDYLERTFGSAGYIQFTDAEGNFDLDYIPPSKVTEELTRYKMLPTIHNPETAAGHLSKGVTQFLTGFVGPVKFLRGAGLGGTMMKNAGAGMGAGAVSDFMVFDPIEGNLSTMLVEQDIPLLNNAVSQYLAIDDDDTESEARLKNVIEGIFLGGPLEIFFGMRAVKKARAEKNFAKKEKIYEEGGKTIEDSKAGKKTKRVKKALVDDNKAINSHKAIKDFKITENTTEADIDELLDGIFNPKGFKNAAHVMRTIKTVAQLFSKEEKQFLLTNKLTNKTAKYIGERLGEDFETILKTIKDDADASELGIFKMVAAKKVLQMLGRELDRVAYEHTTKYVNKGIKSGAGYKASAEKGIALKQLLKHLTLNTKRLIRGAARTTQGGNIKVDPGKKKPVFDIKKMEGIIDTLDDDFDVLAKELSQTDNIDHTIDAATEIHKNKYLKAFQSLYINSLLSGPWTQGVNILSNFYEATLRPATQILGGAATLNKDVMFQGLARYRGMIHNSQGMWSAITKAFKNSDAVLDKKTRTQDNIERGIDGDAINPISGEALNWGGNLGRVADWFGDFAQFPSRLLVTGDEVFKQLNYRGRVYEMAIEQAGKRNLDLSSKKGKEFIQEFLDGAFDPKTGAANIKYGSHKYSSKYNEAIEYAREATFQKELKGNENFIFGIGGNKDWGSTVEGFVNDHPMFRFVVPFVRTPTNLWRNFETHIPGLGLKSKQMKKLYESGPAGKADVIGRQILGTSVMFIGVDYATSHERIIQEGPDGKPIDLPKMTGRGPKDKATRDLWRSTGWQPYSILVNTGTESKPVWKYRQYNRMDPRFYAFGIIADMAEFSKFNPEAFDGDFADDFINLSGGLLSSVMINIGDKSYTKGIGDTMELLNSPTENRASLYFGKMASNFAPYGSLRRSFDDDAVDFRGFTDRTLDGLTFGLRELEAKRDIFGDPIKKAKTTMYFADNNLSKLIQGPALIGREQEIGTGENDSWMYALQALAVKGSLSLVPPKQMQYRGLIDLAEFENEKGQTAIDRWKEIMSEMGVKEKLQYAVEGSRFQSAGAGTKDFKGRKEKEIERQYNRVKDAAERQLMLEYPELKQAIRDLGKEAREYKRPTSDPERQNPGKGGINSLIVY